MCACISNMKLFGALIIALKTLLIQKQTFMKKRRMSISTRLVAVLIAGSASFCLSQQSYAAGSKAGEQQGVTQTKTVKGRVVDANGEPLIGVTVRAEKGNGATITDIDGNFTFDARNGNTVTVSYAGFKTQSVSLKDGIVIKMESDLVGLDDVVVIGYGTIKKRDLTGAVSSVKSDDIARVPVSNPIEAIQGQVAGLDITRTSGDTDAGLNISLRGTRSINGDNTPLFIIDGVQGSYSELNPSDIESIEVLKDASSTAVYGSAGANGVIIITTKSAKEGKRQVNFDAYYGWNTIPSYPAVRTGEDYVNFRRLAQQNAGTYAGEENLFSTAYQTLIDNGNWVNWFDEGTQTGITQSYNLSTSFANDKVSSFFSLNYYNQEGTLEGEHLDRYSARAKIDFKANSILKYGVNLYAMYSNNDRRSSRIWNRMMSTAPLGVPYNEDGSINLDPFGDGGNTLNPIADQAEGQYVSNVKNLSLTPQAYLELTPLKGLRFKSTVSGYFNARKEGLYIGSKSYEHMEKDPISASIPNTLSYRFKWENVLSYNFTINDDHDFALTAVSEWSKNRTERVTATATGFDSDSFGYHNLGAGTGTPTVSSSYVGNQKMSYVARANYSYKGKYLASVSARWDGCSVLADGNKWDIFPAAAIGWRISDEPFMQSLTAISDMKIRASYGVTGNAGAAEYATINNVRTGRFGFGSDVQNYSGFSSLIANKDLGWEKSYQFDAGIDLSLFKSRLVLNVDWYRTVTKDVLYQKSLPYGAGGFGQSAFKTWANVGETRNMGWEIGITSRNIQSRDFSWTTTLNWSTNDEEVVKTTSEGPLQFGDYYLIPGEAVKTYYGYKYLGIWGTAEAEEAAKYGQKPGQVHIAEKGEANYKLNTDDYYVLGNATPKWTASMQNTFTYKGFDLTILMLMRWKYTIHYGMTGWYRGDGVSPSPVICDYWTEDNQSARYAMPDANNGNPNYMDWANYFDGSYFKIKTITLGYTVPQQWLKKLNVERARIYFTANNPFVFTKCSYLKDYDPEKGGNDDDTPLSKQFVFGINLTF